MNCMDGASCLASGTHLLLSGQGVAIPPPNYRISYLTTASWYWIPSDCSAMRPAGNIRQHVICMFQMFQILFQCWIHKLRHGRLAASMVSWCKVLSRRCWFKDLRLWNQCGSTESHASKHCRVPWKISVYGKFETSTSQLDMVRCCCWFKVRADMPELLKGQLLKMIWKRFGRWFVFV